MDAEFGDIKELWEPARFGWVYDLVRGYLITGENRYAEALHRNIQNWLAASTPFMGPHWSCGQEAAIRAAALLYAEANISGAPSSTPAAMAALRFILAASGERIADAIGYAESQRNNHGISEAAGLVMLGVRFRDQHPEAERWLRTGRRLLHRLIAEQFAADGWYIQHSFNYLRVAFDQCVLAGVSLSGVGMPLSTEAVRRLAAAADLLFAVIEPTSGEPPNHGASDGAFVHPITLGEYRDFRPVLTAVCALLRQPLPADIPVDREVLAWLGLEEPPRGPELAHGVRTGASGWAAARIGSTQVFLRAGHYRSRPGHIDPLHLDIRLQGKEVVVDPGTYSYNAASPWNTGLALAGVHNGPIVDEIEPGVRGPRFLWLKWPEARVVVASGNAHEVRITAEVPGSHRRTVVVRQDYVDVEDRFFDSRASSAEVRWLLHPDVKRDMVVVEGESDLIAATEGSTAGWFSPYYLSRVPSLCVRVRRNLREIDQMRVEFRLI